MESLVVLVLVLDQIDLELTRKDFSRPCPTWSVNINPLTPQSFFYFLHIFVYIFVQKYHLLNNLEIGHLGRFSFQDSSITLDE